MLSTIKALFVREPVINGNAFALATSNCPVLRKG